MWWRVHRGQRSAGRRAVDDDVVELDMVTSGDRLSTGRQQQQQQKRRRATTTELYSVDDLPRVTHLNDAEVY